MLSIILGVDTNEATLKSYKTNHPEVETWQTDILKLSAEDLPKADVIIGSTPCAEFSILKKNRTYDMTLTNHFLKIVNDYKPKYWMLENVPGISKFLTVPFNILKRCIAGNYPYPTPTHASFSNQTLENKPLHSWIRFREIKYPDGGKPFSKKAITGAFRRANEMGKKKCNFMPQFIDDGDVLPTITSSEFHGIRASCTIVYDHSKLRPLSFRECTRAQSFPDDYVFVGTQAQCYHQVGDAVPPLRTKAIGDTIRANEEETEECIETRV